MVADCKIVDIPPKLMTNEHKTVESSLFETLDNERQPFVISIMPSNRPMKFAGRNENIGEKHSITIKKMVIMHPTERIERTEFVITSDRSRRGLLRLLFNLGVKSSPWEVLILNFLNKRPLTKAPIM